MRLGVMQPYIFPYIGYFQLIKAVDTFIFYDDVNYIKRGWVNRNRVLVNKKEHFLTIPCVNASQNRQINEIDFDSNKPEFQKLARTIELAYKKAPYFNQVFSLIDNIIKTPTDKISVLAIQSVLQIANYLDIKAKFKISSLDFPDTKGLEKANRLIELCKKTNSNHYINAIGGKDLYDKSSFEKQEIQLDFIKALPIQYRQFNNVFVPWLSIIDVIMFNSVEEIAQMLNQYILE